MFSGYEKNAFYSSRLDRRVPWRCLLRLAASGGDDLVACSFSKRIAVRAEGGTQRGSTVLAYGHRLPNINELNASEPVLHQ